MRFLVLAQCTAIAFGTMVAGVSQRELPNGGTPLTGQEPIRVAMYFYGGGFSREISISLDMMSGRLTAVEKGRPSARDPVAYRIAKYTVPKKDLSALRKDLDRVGKSLRSFAPKSSWFGLPPLDAGQTVLQVSWGKSVVYLALPAYGQLSPTAPKAARHIYSQLRQISHVLVAMYRQTMNGSWSTPESREWKEDDPAARALERERVVALQKSQPKRRARK